MNGRDSIIIILEPQHCIVIEILMGHEGLKEL